MRGSSVVFWISVPYCMMAGRNVVHADDVERQRRPRTCGLLGVDQLLEHRRSAAAIFSGPGHGRPAGVGHRSDSTRAASRMSRRRGRTGVGRRSARRSDSRTARRAVRSGTVPPPPGMRNPRCPCLPRVIDCGQAGLYVGTDIWSTTSARVRRSSVAQDALGTTVRRAWGCSLPHLRADRWRLPNSNQVNPRGRTVRRFTSTPPRRCARNSRRLPYRRR